MSTIEDIREATAALGEDERETLIATLIDDMPVPATTPEMSEEWREEVARRFADIDAGRSKTVPSGEVWKRLNKRFGTSL